MTSKSLNVLQKTVLSDQESKLLRKYRRNKVAQWFLLFVFSIVFLGMMAHTLGKDCVSRSFKDVIWDILFLLLSVYIAVLCLKRIINLQSIKIDSLMTRKATITEKKSVRSSDLINRSRNIFVAAKIDDDVTLYADCSQRDHNKAIVNKSVGLFFTLGDDKVRVIVL